MHILTCCAAWHSLMGQGVVCAERSKQGARKEGHRNQREDRKLSVQIDGLRRCLVTRQGIQCREGITWDSDHLRSVASELCVDGSDWVVPTPISMLGTGGCMPRGWPMKDLASGWAASLPMWSRDVVCSKPTFCTADCFCGIQPIMTVSWSTMPNAAATVIRADPPRALLLPGRIAESSTLAPRLVLTLLRWSVHSLARGESPRSMMAAEPCAVRPVSAQEVHRGTGKGCARPVAASPSANRGSTRL